ncbi:MAG TPA: (d)CMP kinase [Oscillospiraceae bacterium]|nr:(d)CMP kinase [Oscillospiraceae bacterium]
MRSIAIDGPSGAGKTTTAKALARELGFLYVDTGAIYRVVGLYVNRKGVDPHDAGAVTALLPEIEIGLRHGKDGAQIMLLGHEDVTQVIRASEISRFASAVSAIPEVRAYLMEMQRSLARAHDVVMDGRDIGTVVLPDADLKIFLTAAPGKRAERRYKELLERGAGTDYETVLKELSERDANDCGRAAAPLRQAPDALLVDTGELTFEETVSLLARIARERLGL